MSNQKTKANAQIAVQKYEPTEYDKPPEGPVLSKIHIEETFTGDIEGSGIVEFLQAARADGTANFVGIERVTGKIAGKSGTFLLQDAGTIQDRLVNGEWSVIPGSGTGELKGLRGEGGFQGEPGRRCAGVS